MAFAFDCSFRDVEWPYRVAGAGCAAVSRRALSGWLRRRAGGGGEILPQDNADGPVDRARNRCDRFGRTRMVERQDSVDLCALGCGGRAIRAADRFEAASAGP